MRNRYINDRTGKFGPEIELQRRIHHDQICQVTDRMLKEKEKREKIYGPREIFLEEYNKNGYEAAKNLLNSKYGEAFNNEICFDWIGIGNVRKILFLEYKENGIKRAHEKAEEINKKIECKVLNNEDVERMISEEIQKEKQEEKKKEDRNADDAR